MTRRLTYKSSGVDINKADEFIRSIKALMQGTMGAAVLKRTKAFGSLFAFDSRKYREPILVSSADGVGTKLLIAQMMDKHDTVGIDLVAMNVNDVLCVGAQPLFFLDYIACGKVKPEILKAVIRGIAVGCRQSQCSLIGGETAEMPGLYGKNEYDLAGFAVGVVERKKVIDGSAIQVGDQIIGLASNGLHSNGFSLVRRVFSLREQKRLATELLRPTRIYVPEVLEVIRRFKVHGIAHVTGGAFYEKMTKILPEGKCLFIRKKSWLIPEIFQQIQRQGQISDHEMYRTFNMGIGMILVVPAKSVSAVRTFLTQKQVTNKLIGEIVANHSVKIQFQK